VGITCTAAAALALSACGSEQPASPSGADLSSNAAVSTRDVTGVGTVLVDNAGKTLYFTDSDEAGTIRCTADCLKLWQPAPAPDKIIGTNLGAVDRPEGTGQLTYQGRPLYTFTMDSADKPASGHNATDSFDGVDFTWHAVILSVSEAPGQDDSGGGGGY
jgi:predicted lipoprotein with Yx(FWY)xxD motif